MKSAYFDYHAAKGVADGLVELLSPVCERIEIAGSLRRKKLRVGDVELVYVPKTRPVTDLLGEVCAVHNLVDELLSDLIADGRLEKRLNVKGSTSWGEKNKLALHVPSGIPVDLFSITQAAFENYMVCRTGPASLNLEIAMRAQRKSFKWCPYDGGFRSMSAGTLHPVRAEKDVFDFVGLDYMPPPARSDFETRKRINNDDKLRRPESRRHFCESPVLVD